MKFKISRYKVQKVLDTEIEIDVPEQPEFHFQTGIRRSIAIFPEWTTWNEETYKKPEEVWKVKFVCVYLSFENKIEVTEVQLNHIKEPTGLERGGSVVEFFLNGRSEYTKRTKEQFMDDYNRATEKTRLLFTENGLL